MIRLRAEYAGKRARREGGAVDDHDHDHAGEPPCPAPRPSDAGRDGPAAVAPEDDFDADAELTRWVADIEAGRERIPEPWESEGPAISLSLGDASDIDPALLAAMCGPDGLGGQALSPAFGQSAAADALARGADRLYPGGPAAAELVRLAADGAGRGVRPPPRRPVRGRQGAQGPRRAPARGVPGRRAGGGV